MGDLGLLQSLLCMYTAFGQLGICEEPVSPCLPVSPLTLLCSWQAPVPIACFKHSHNLCAELLVILVLVTLCLTVLSIKWTHFSNSRKAAGFHSLFCPVWATVFIGLWWMEVYLGKIPQNHNISHQSSLFFTNTCLSVCCTFPLISTVLISLFLTVLYSL